MSFEFWAAVIGQTIILIVSIIAATVRTERRITKVEVKVEHLEGVELSRSHEYRDIAAQVRGVSRAVARLEGHAAYGTKNAASD